MDVLGLPPFLKPVESRTAHSGPYYEATFPHDKLGASAHALWWPSHSNEIKTVLLFVPGNPGLLHFYTPFLTAIHEKAERKLAILAHSHLGHTPGVGDSKASYGPSTFSLAAQVESAIEAVEAIQSQHRNAVKVVVAGHSVGFESPAESVSSVLLLFPTIAHIVDTPNGRRLSWAFRAPFPRILSYASVTLRILPSGILASMFSDWPMEQVAVLRTLLFSPSAIYACLTMADEEMNTICDADIALLQEYRHRMHLYFAEDDDWVGDTKEVVLKAFHPDPGSVKIVHGHRDIPHAFCINHGEHLAEQCYEWLRSGGFVLILPSFDAYRDASYRVFLPFEPEPAFCELQQGASKMADSSSDPLALFSSPVPHDPLSDHPGPDDTSISESMVDERSPSPQMQTNPSPPTPYVLVPPLDTPQKALYPAGFAERERTSESSLEDDLDCVIGEYKDGEQLFYYARRTDGIAYKYPAEDFESNHPDLVKEYRQCKADGTLDPFDPSAHYIHPESRIKVVLKISRQTARKKPSRKKPALFDPNQETEHANSCAGANKKLAHDLPFSPNKRRSGRRLAVPSSDGEDEVGTDSDIVEVSQPTRKSGRVRQSARQNLDDANYEDDTFAEESDGYMEASLKSKLIKKKKIVRGKASRPADEETAVLRAHRHICEKCHRPPAHVLLSKPKKGRKKKRGKSNEDDFEDDSDDETRFQALGGWLEMPPCRPLGCLARTQRDEILRAALERDKAEWQKAQSAGENQSLPEPAKRPGLEAYQTTEFICGSCMKGGICMGCKEVAIKPDESTKPSAEPKASVPPADVAMADETSTVPPLAPVVHEDEVEPSHELLFRCLVCKRLAHYAHLPVPQDEAFPHEDVTAVDLAEYYQTTTNWQCADCVSYIYSVEHILAWRPYPSDAVEPSRSPNEPVNYKAALPREYLVKWESRSYKRTQWVPHMWLLATHAQRLKNFLAGGSKVQLLPDPVSDERAEGDEEPTTFEIGEDDVRETPARTSETQAISALDANPDAERKIPPAWKTVDRVLDVLFWHPQRQTKLKLKSHRKKGLVVTSDEEDDPVQYAIDKEYQAAYDEGEEPSKDLTETVGRYVSRTHEKLDGKASSVIWAFFKWHDLGYEDASWDAPPRKGELGYPAFEKAFKRFVDAQSVVVHVRHKDEATFFDNRKAGEWLKRHAFTHELQPELGQSAQLKLMPFQIDGVNWLCNNWWNHQNCILADEMGLGKTVQIATFIGHIMKQCKAYPALVVVPNSTISNWVREFERWAPKLRVVPFHGEAKAREVIKRFELTHAHPAKGTTGAKYHVLITTYEMITNPKEFTPVFKNVPRWEILVVDEGQRLKNDSSLIFKKLKELNTIHRIIMTGTPLNNNIRELFNLMNFLDPDGWHDLDALAKQFEELSEDLIKDLHVRLRPYFLRRIKAEVLQLPPKNEVIVPVSMTPLQKEVYRSILSQNLDILQTLAQGAAGAKQNVLSRTNLKNMLMQLRKCVQHPYLVSDDIEPRGLSPQETHEKLIDASAKLRLLKVLLPKLRARGHRVLLFSQFVIALNIVEDFLIGEGMKYLRLDGNTKQADRQKDMDEFNKPDSDVFIYLLTTRAGALVSISGARTPSSSSTPTSTHIRWDLQAIARAHRFGQTKTCLVFKLMAKDSAEERIMQTGKKKLVLDHLIVQKMDDDSESHEDVKSILMFGAKALFEADDTSQDIHYSEHDIDNLIEKTEKEGDQAEPEAATGMSFAFAKVWSADKDALEDMADEAEENVDQVDSWTQALERIAAERTKERAKEITGRGARRKAAAVFPQQNLDLDDTPTKDKEKEKHKSRKGKGKSKAKAKSGSDDSEFHIPSGLESDGLDSEQTTPLEGDDVMALLPPAPRSSSPPLRPQPLPVPRPMLAARPKPKDTTQPLSAILNRREPPRDSAEGELCGLCATRHGAGECRMTESPENLAHYRLMLLCHAGDEPLEERRAAIQAIDEALHKLGKIHLIYGQPLQLVETPPSPQRKKPKMVTTSAASESSTSVKKDQTRKVDSTASKTVAPQAVVAPPRPAQVKPKPRATNGTMAGAVAGPSKRARSPLQFTDVPKKKVKESSPSSCAICGRSPHHLVKDCPIVAEGPKRYVECKSGATRKMWNRSTSRIQSEIKRLESDPTQVSTVKVLRHILIKQQRRTLASSSIPAGSGSLVDMRK
ncbi:Chromatin remodeling factor mit1 [Grifola frondosa]|uniref:Chromatin remodeling factor mit1 n=1 Tax=Grifola frondosa TaxID=5627 RepID=A0A1C7MR58_GRIFR|nr:Chromatin remodeling factor mit1 [Grifola frondosa]